MTEFQILNFRKVVQQHS